MNSTQRRNFSYISPYLLIILFKIIEKEQVTILDYAAYIGTTVVQTKLTPIIGIFPSAIITGIVYVAIKKPESTIEVILACANPKEHGKAILLRHNDEYIPVTKENVEYYTKNIQTIKSMTGYVVDGIKTVGKVSFNALGKIIIDDTSRSTGTMSNSDYQKNNTDSSDYGNWNGYGDNNNSSSNNGSSGIDYSHCTPENSHANGYSDEYGMAKCHNDAQNTAGDSGGSGGDSGGGGGGGCYLI